MSPKWRFFVPGYIWAAFNTLIGVILSFFYHAHSYRWEKGVLTCVAHREDVIGHPGGQTWGWLIIYTDPRYRTESWAAGLRRHEHKHVWQGLVFGPLMLLAYAGIFLYHYFTEQKDEEPGWRDDYLRNNFEVNARHEEDHIGGWGT